MTSVNLDFVSIDGTEREFDTMVYELYKSHNIVTERWQIDDIRHIIERDVNIYEGKNDPSRWAVGAITRQPDTTYSVVVKLFIDDDMIPIDTFIDDSTPDIFAARKVLNYMLLVGYSVLQAR